MKDMADNHEEVNRSNALSLNSLFSNAPKFKNNPQAVEKALELYRTYH
ncbi:hypothetical protein ACWIG3_26495 [Streptomyces celluloflavus]